jgi:hypothetical protein
MIHRFIVLALLFIPPVYGQRTTGAHRAGEPFDSFQAIDKILSSLDTQLTQADSVLQKAGTGSIATSSGKRGRPPWAVLGQQILTNARTLDSRIMRLRSHYRTKRVSQQLFSGLVNADKGFTASARRFERSQTAVQARGALKQLQQSRLDLVLAFHSLSSDYGALRCQKGSWACCEVAGRNGNAACRWTCVRTPRQCRGLLGPRSTAASTDVIRH